MLESSCRVTGCLNRAVLCFEQIRTRLETRPVTFTRPGSLLETRPETRPETLAFHQKS